MRFDLIIWTALVLSKFLNAQEINTIRTIAGSLSWTTSAGSQAGYAGDGGPATDALMNNPRCVFRRRNGLIYICDSENHVIRLVDRNNIISTFAGTFNASYEQDTLGLVPTEASLNYPFALVIDSVGSIYISDQDNTRVRRIRVANGLMFTFAGDGTRDYRGDGGLASLTGLNTPRGLFISTNNYIFIADHSNAAIRRVNLVTNIIRTVVGTPGVPGFGGDGGPATSALLDKPNSLWMNSLGVMYIADRKNCAIRRVSASGIITTYAGTPLDCDRAAGDGGPASSAKFRDPRTAWGDTNGNIYISDKDAYTIRRVNVTDGIITRFAGNGRNGFAGDGGPATSARLRRPSLIHIDRFSQVYLADAYNDRIRVISQPIQPTPAPTSYPSSFPSSVPTGQPNGPSTEPSSIPSAYPTVNPTSNPSPEPSSQPSSFPTFTPKVNQEAALSAIGGGGGLAGVIIAGIIAYLLAMLIICLVCVRPTFGGKGEGN